MGEWIDAEHASRMYLIIGNVDAQYSERLVIRVQIHHDNDHDQDPQIE